MRPDKFSTTPRIFASANGSQSVEEIVALIGRIQSSVEKNGSNHASEIARMQSQIVEMSTKIAAGRLGSVADFGPNLADRNAFASYCKTGIRGAMTTDSSPDGGYMVPQTLDNQIAKIARDYSPIRQIATVVTASGVYKKLVSLNGATANWRSERSSVPETPGMSLAEITPPEGELTASPRVSNWLLDDSQYDVATELSTEIATLFAQKEGQAFVSGDGIEKPRGFLTATTVDNAAWTWGKLGWVKTGDANAFIAATTTVSPADCLVDLMYSLKAEYRANATWTMNSATAGIVRKLKNSDGHFIWQDALQQGQPALLLGRPVAIVEGMDNVAAGKFPIAIGDFARGYLILDRPGLRVLRDPFSAKPYVIFDTMKRVGGCVLDYGAIKLLKVSA